jgi:hypothetical protein
MRKILYLALLTMMSALVLFANNRPATADCVDFDNDGVCSFLDCDDFNPNITNNGDVDEDGDGFTVCMGDCDDGDPAVQFCLRTIIKTDPHRVPFYTVPSENCGGLTIHHEFYRCTIDPAGSKCCETTPFWTYDEEVLKNCT